jgi:uncharacterized repeat protein (TIGR04076 family)
MTSQERTVPEDRIDKLRRKLKEKGNWIDEELDRLSPKQWVFLDREHKLRHYKIVAEVVRVIDHCELQPKIGDKFTFAGGGMLIPEETTFPGVCLWAVASLFPLSMMIMDRILAGLDPNEMWRDQVSCMDSSIRDGGLGQVVFKVQCVKS